MSQPSNYQKIKWAAFFITISVFLLGFSLLYFLSEEPKPQSIPEKVDKVPLENYAGHFSNENFSRLLEENLSELEILEEIHFQGQKEGQFHLSAVLKSSDRLIALCPELKAFKSLLSTLENETVTIQGHLGETNEGNGQFIADSIRFLSYSFPAGPLTDYLDRYTAINDLFAAPLNEITIDSSGITFSKSLPPFINQTA